jgi:hypothetical protein
MVDPEHQVLRIDQPERHAGGRWQETRAGVEKLLDISMSFTA